MFNRAKICLLRLGYKLRAESLWIQCSNQLKALPFRSGCVAQRMVQFRWLRVFEWHNIQLACFKVPHQGLLKTKLKSRELNCGLLTDRALLHERTISLS